MMGQRRASTCMEKMVWSQPGIISDLPERTIEAAHGSERLLEAMSRQFERHATLRRIAPRPDLGLGCADVSRLLLMNCRDRV